jgi:FixJ family two-component response regulator
MCKNLSKVYVIDGDESVRRGFAKVFGTANLLVETFSSVEEFLAVPRARESACVLVDMRTLDAVAFDFREKLADLGAGLPLIVTSASDDALIRDRARDLGAAAFFKTPVDKEAILDAVWWSISSSNGK